MVLFNKFLKSRESKRLEKEEKIANERNLYLINELKKSTILYSEDEISRFERTILKNSKLIKMNNEKLDLLIFYYLNSFSKVSFESKILNYEIKEEINRLIQDRIEGFDIYHSDDYIIIKKTEFDLILQKDACINELSILEGQTKKIITQYNMSKNQQEKHMLLIEAQKLKEMINAKEKECDRISTIVIELSSAISLIRSFCILKNNERELELVTELEDVLDFANRNNKKVKKESYAYTEKNDELVSIIFRLKMIISSIKENIYDVKSLDSLKKLIKRLELELDMDSSFDDLCINEEKTSNDLPEKINLNDVDKLL